MLIASLIFNHKWLKGNLGKKHPLWTCRLMTTMIGGVSIIDKMKDKIGFGYGRCEDMQVTGVPPDLILANQLDSLKMELRDFTS